MAMVLTELRANPSTRYHFLDVPCETTAKDIIAGFLESLRKRWDSDAKFVIRIWILVNKSPTRVADTAKIYNFWVQANSLSSTEAFTIWLSIFILSNHAKPYMVFSNNTKSYMIRMKSWQSH